MPPRTGYERFQDLIFQELEERQRLVTNNAVEEFVHYAETKGFTLEQLIRMTQSGMSGKDVWAAVHSA